MNIVGYSDRLSVAPGERIRFLVSCKESTYEAKIVRLIHGDTNPDGPGFKEELVDTSIDGTYEGREQQYEAGSYARIPDSPTLRLASSFALEAWIYPTTPGTRAQALLTKWSAAPEAGYGLFLDEAGCLMLMLADGKGSTARISTGAPLRAFSWYFVSGRYDAARAVVELRQEPALVWPLDDSRTAVEAGVDTVPAETNEPFMIAAHSDEGRARGHFNGKIDRPRVLGDGDRLVAAWDFSADPSSRKVLDTSPNRHDGETVNTPTRAVTGHNWTGREMNWTHARSEYGAIFFHDDDLDDAGWEVDFELKVPEDLRSGVFAARLRTNDSEDHIPFFVRPKPGSATAPIALLIPTFSYLAYGNEHVSPHHPQVSVPLERLQSEDYYAQENRLLSLYDTHDDGVGCCFASRLRPLVNMRPKYRLALIDGPHQLGADLHLVDWLEAIGHPYDVITDEDLHAEGQALLGRYRAVVTGTHPEYWTERMLDGLEGYVDDGGHVMYLGGNSFYWVISVDPERPHVIELRRGQRGSRPFSSAIGENYHATTGELGGLWRDRGRAPQKLLGVGHAVMGFGRAIPFRRQPDSFGPRVSFIFEGVSEDGPIGDFGLVLGGAAGHEVDRLEYRLGTPPHALLLATATDFSNEYQRAIEELEINDGKQGGADSAFVRGDMVFFETPGGGAVFSTGSMCWCGSLSYNNYDNDVSRVTDNVLRRFAL